MAGYEDPVDPAEPVKRVLAFKWDRNQAQGEGKWSRAHYRCMENADMDRASRRLRKERKVSLIFAWGLGFLLRMVV